jgi:hypothetical protein
VLTRFRYEVVAGRRGGRRDPWGRGTPASPGDGHAWPRQQPRRQGQHSWAGEVEGLQVSLAGANEKLAQIDNRIARRPTTIDLGVPSFSNR